MNYDDRITSISTGATTPEGRDVVQSVNASDSTIHGVEAGADVDISDALHINVLINYTWGEQTVAGSPTEPADRIPPLTGRVMATYDTGDDFVFDAWLRFAGEQDRLSARDIRDVRIDPAGTSGWGILGLRARWDYREAWQFALGVDNVFDKQYRVHGSGLDAPGRNVFANVRVSW